MARLQQKQYQLIKLSNNEDTELYNVVLKIIKQAHIPHKTQEGPIAAEIRFQVRQYIESLCIFTEEAE